MNFCVRLNAEALVRTRVHVTAQTKEEAKTKAMAQASEGDVVWEYDGCTESPVECESVEEE